MNIFKIKMASHYAAIARGEKRNWREWIDYSRRPKSKLEWDMFRRLGVDEFHNWDAYRQYRQFVANERLEEIQEEGMNK